LIEGRAPRAGEIFRNPGYARALHAIAEGGAPAYYTGQLATALADVVQAAGGVLTTTDLAAHHSTWAAQRGVSRTPDLGMPAKRSGAYRAACPQHPRRA